nr:2-methylcitrate dehydratase [Quercus suber]
MDPGPGPAYDDYLVDIVQYFYSEPQFSNFALQRARLVLLDSLGCAIETATQSQECRAMLGPVVPGTIVKNGCHVPGTAFVLDPVKASFDIGTLIRYLDHNDGYTGHEWGHPSDMFGAILAVADWQTRTASYPDRLEQKDSADPTRPRAGGPVTIGHVLEATIKAFEVHCLFQHENSFNKRGLDHTILVKVGSVVAVSWLLGLHQEQALAALSQVYQDGGMLRTYRQTPNAGPRKGWAAGDACMRAVHLALLTKAGQPGAPRVLTDPKWGFYKVLFAGQSFKAGKRYGSYAVEHNAFKLVAVEGHGISACNAAVIVAKRLSDAGLSPRDIAKVSIRTMRAAMTNIDKSGPLRNAADRDHCLSYMVAVTLLRGSLPEAKDFDDESVFADHGEIDRLRRSTIAHEDPDLTRDYFDPAKRTIPAGVTITLLDGRTLDEVLVESPLGMPNHPDTSDAVLSKFRKNMSLAFDPEAAERAISTLQESGTLISTFMDIFWRGKDTCKPMM